MAALTILQFADRLEKIGKDLNKAVLPPFRKNLQLMQKALMAEYWRSEFGARIWRWATEKFGGQYGPSVKLGTSDKKSYARWSKSQQAFIASIYVRPKSLAEKIELGGKRLRKHNIYGRVIREPGVAVPQMAVFNRVIDRLWDKTVDDVSDEYGKFIERTL